MATGNNPPTDSKKRKQRYRPHNKAVKKKGAYPLHPGVQGFFITCDGGRELQASREAINVIDTFYEELVSGKETNGKPTGQPKKPSNKKIKFTYSDDEEEEDDCKEEKGKQEEDDDSDENNNSDDGKEQEEKEENEAKSSLADNVKVTDEKLCSPNVDNVPSGSEAENPSNGSQEGAKDLIDQENEAIEPLTKNPCVDSSCPKGGVDTTEKSIDKLIDEELKELGDRNKRLFVNLDSGCNGVVFIQMRKRDGDPSPKDVAQHMMTSAASTKKHMSRFILRVLPIEVACYSSEEEISKAIAPLVATHFPADAQEPAKFAVLYEARANTGIDRMKIIDAVAKSVPAPHKVDLRNPDKTIVVEIAKTVCLIGVVEKYKELSKYNLRQLTSP